MNKITLSDKTFPAISYYKIGQGPALTLLHGFPVNADVWHKVWDKLSEQCTLIIPDLPGIGESISNNNTTSMEELAAGVADILDNELIEETVVAGHSMGGYIALCFADNYGHRTKGLSLVHSTASPDTEEKKANRNKAITIFEAGGKNQFLKQMIPTLFTSSFVAHNPDEITKWNSIALEIKTESLVAFYKAMIGRKDRTEILKRALTPTQFILGKEDKVIEIHKVLAQTTLSNINFVSIYANSAHMSMLEHADQLAEDLQAFSSFCHKE